MIASAWRNNVMSLPYPKSFPTHQEETFLELVLCADQDFHPLWDSWIEKNTFEGIDGALLRLAPLIYLRMRHLGIRDGYYDRLKGVYRSAWVRNQRILTITKTIASLSAEHDIPFLILKGTPLLLEVYRDKGARFLGDADILIPPEYGEKVISLLLRHGFRYGSTYAPDVYHPTSSIYQVIKETGFVGPGEIEVDLHWNIFLLSHHARAIDLFLLRQPSSKAFRVALWQSAVRMNIDGVPCLRLSNEHFLIHLIIHGTGGSKDRSIRWVVDVLRAMEVFPIDWKVMIAIAEKFGFKLEIYLAARYLKERWQAPIPDWFLTELESLPFKRHEMREYASYANIAHEERYSLLGNLPTLWYAYWTHETRRSPFGFVRYIMRTYGASNFREFAGFIIKKYSVRLRTWCGLNNASGPDAMPLKESTKNAVYVTAGRVVAFAASLTAVMVMAAHVPREVVGSYNYLMATLGILSLFTLPGMNSALVRAVAQGNDGSVWPMLKVRLRWGVLSALGTALIGAGFLFADNHQIGWAFIASSPFVPISGTFGSLATNFWQGKKRFGLSSIVTITYFTTIALASIPIFIFSDDLIFIAASVAFVNAAVSSILFLTIRRHATGTHSPESLSLGFHLTAMQVLRTVSENLDRIFVWWLLGPVATAIHAFAAAPVMKAFHLLPIGTVTLPHLSTHKHTDELKRSVLRKTFLLFLLITPLVVLGIMLAPFLFSLAFPNYPESVVYFQIMFTCVIFAPVGLLRSALTAFQKTRELYISEICTHGVKFVALFGLGIPFGLLGIAWSAPLIGAFEFALLLVLFLRTAPDEVTTISTNSGVKTETR